MTSERDPEGIALDRERFGTCPACGEVLAYDSEEDLTFCPAEDTRHPQLPSKVAVQSVTPLRGRARFLVGATSVDGRASSIEVFFDDLPSAPWRALIAIEVAAERLARALIAAGARRGSFFFSDAMLNQASINGDPLEGILALIHDGGTGQFTA